MKITCTDNAHCKDITIGNSYRIVREHPTGATIKNDRNVSVFYPWRCFGLKEGD